MTAGASSRRNFLGTLGILVVVSGCSASPPVHLYTLSWRSGAKTGTVAKIIGVKPVDFPKDLDRAELVYNSGAYELHASEYERWGEGMQDMLTSVLIANLADRLPNSHVLETSGSVMVPFDITIEIAITQLEAAPEGGIATDAQWAVLVEGRKPSLRSQARQTPGRTDAPTALAAAMSDALAALSDAIAASVVEITA